MHRDYLRDLELLGVTARLKRLSDGLSESIRALYRANDVDIEPGWHLVLLFLEDGSATPTELAASLRLSQPAVTKMVNRMAARGYVEAFPDPDDRRKKKVRLSPEARERLPGLERIWAAGRSAVRDILGGDTTFLAHLAAFEDQVERKSFSERALEHLRER